MTEWIDKYWILVDQGYSRYAALAIVCMEFGLSSYDEEWIKEQVK